MVWIAVSQRERVLSKRRGKQSFPYTTNVRMALLGWGLVVAELKGTAPTEEDSSSFLLDPIFFGGGLAFTRSSTLCSCLSRPQTKATISTKIISRTAAVFVWQPMLSFSWKAYGN